MLISPKRKYVSKLGTLVWESNLHLSGLKIWIMYYALHCKCVLRINGNIN